MLHTTPKLWTSKHDYTILVSQNLKQQQCAGQPSNSAAIATATAATNAAAAVVLLLRLPLLLGVSPAAAAATAINPSPRTGPVVTAAAGAAAEVRSQNGGLRGGGAGDRGVSAGWHGAVDGCLQVLSLQRRQQPALADGGWQE